MFSVYWLLLCSLVLLYSVGGALSGPYCARPGQSSKSTHDLHTRTRNRPPSTTTPAGRAGPGRSGSAHNATGPEASIQGETPSNEHTQPENDHQNEDDRMAADSAVPTPQANTGIAGGHGESNPGSQHIIPDSPRQSGSPGPDLGSNDADHPGAEQTNSPPSPPPYHDSDDPHDPDVGDQGAGGQDAGDRDEDGQDEDSYPARNAQRPDVQADDLPGGPNDWNPDDIVPHLDALRNSAKFIDGLRAATLDNGPIPFDVRERLRSPIAEPLHIDKVLRYCLDVYLATTGTHGSEATYDDICAALKRLSPDIADILSHDQLKRKIAELTGVVPIMTDMCSNSCMAFTGPFSDLRACPECSAGRYETVT